MKQDAQMLAEARVRLMAGFKRYFHGKRSEGLLSARGMQVLEYATNMQIDAADTPLFLWATVEKCAFAPRLPNLLPTAHSVA